jgi:hypothetical protein
MGKQEPREHDRQQKLQHPDTGIAGERKQDPGQRLQMRHDLAQHGAQIGRRPIPEVIERATDQRPILDLRHRRWHDNVTCAQLFSELSHPLHRPDPEPGRRSDDDSQCDQGQDQGGDARMAAEHPCEPVEDRIERDREHDAPGQDRHERADQDERPVDQQRQQSETNCELDEFVSGHELAKGFQERALD